MAVDNDLDSAVDLIVSINAVNKVVDSAVDNTVQASVYTFTGSQLRDLGTQEMMHLSYRKFLCSIPHGELRSTLNPSLDHFQTIKISNCT